MPTFTKTELITGTHTSAAQKPVEPEDIAAAVIKMLEKPTTLVSVPPWGRFISCRSRADAVCKGSPLDVAQDLGNDTVFLELRRKARQNYEQRAQAAQGVVESPER